MSKEINQITQVTIGLIQIHATEDIEKNIKKTVAKVEEAIKKGAQIICLQELYKSIYFPQYKDFDFEKYAETIPGESTNIFSKIAKQHEVVMIVPLFEKATDGKYYNTAVVIDADGKLLTSYRKTHIPHDELFWERDYFAPGDSGYQVYHTCYGNFAVLICYDQWYPEAARSVLLKEEDDDKKPDIIFYPSAIGNVTGWNPPEGDWHTAWQKVQEAHAISNSVYVASVDRVGTEGELEFWGQSFVCDAFGQQIAKASETDDEALVVTIDLTKTKPLRKAWGFVGKRRPETYGHMTKGSTKK